MKVLIVSDTHRNDDNFCEIVSQSEKFDLVIHLGDAEGTDAYLKEVAGCPLEIIAGNNDFFSDLPREKEIELEGCRILLTHGHYYYVSVGMERIRQEGRERGFDIVMFGHTHRPLIEEGKGGVTLINPGSLSYPRQAGHRPSYIIMEIERGKKAHFDLNYM